MKLQTHNEDECRSLHPELKKTVQGELELTTDIDKVYEQQGRRNGSKGRSVNRWTPTNRRVKWQKTKDGQH